MTYILVPRGVTATSATIWVASLRLPGEARSLELATDGRGICTPGPWEEWAPQGGSPGIRHREIVVTDLSPRTRYDFRLRADGASVAKVQVTTLPIALPLLGDKPFSVLLGSCFSLLQDEEGKVGKTFDRIPAASRPDVKILAGDQVYLDSPWQRFAAHTHTKAEMGAIFLDNYAKTWTQEPGFRTLLASGGNFFCSDDHEFWNNAPNSATLLRDTWPGIGNRQAWLDVARQLYRIFQAPRWPAKFSVPPLSFLVAETRYDREADRDRFMKDAALDEIAQWVETLPGPGLLVLGQPLLYDTTSWASGTFGDWNLPDYKQYGRLVDILMRTRHSLTILTGDVHYGRISRCVLPSGSELIEVISSPMSLVDPLVKGKWERAPAVFPSGISDFPKIRVETLDALTTADSHFLTLEFTGRGDGAVMAVRLWPVLYGEIPPASFGSTVWETLLH